MCSCTGGDTSSPHLGKAMLMLGIGLRGCHSGSTKNITEFFTIGIFKLNFIGMKRKALPAISKCIDKLYTILPKLARKKMDKILKECHANKTRW